MSVRDPQKTKEDPERIEPQQAADPELIALISEGDRAFDRFEHTAALEAYTHALAWEPAEALPDQERIRLLIRRAQTYRALGDREHQIKDCLELEPLARRVNTAEVMAEAAIWFADLSLTTAVRGDALELAEDAVEMARASGQRELEARALTALGMMYGNVERFEQAEATLQEALALFEETDEHFARAACLIYLSMAPSARSGPRSEELSFQALDIVRRSGDRRREARVLLFISGRVDDAATGRRHAEAALALAEELGLVEVTAQAYNHLSLIYMSLGLYSTADFYAQGSIDIARKGNNHGLLGATLESEGRIRMGMQDLPGAERAFQESLDLSKQLGIKDWIGINKLGLARLALEQGDVESADALAEEAIQLFRDVNRSHGLAYALAFLAEVRLAQRNWKAALKLASEATQVARSSGALSEEFHPQAVWWTYYHVLKAHPKRRKYLDTKDHSKGTLKEEAHAALQRAFELAQASVGDVSDEGLRRSYWNKVAVNRQILFELAQEETTKDWTPQLIEAQERTDLQEQLRRMLQIGVRMNQIREPDRLIRFVMDQLIELSGAERAAWIVRSADERLSLRAKRGFADDEEALGHTALLLGKETHTHRPILRQAVSDQDPTKDPDGLLDSQSVMVVPLAEPGGGHAWLYAENHTLFGQFTEADVTLVSAFANQVAAALDNATLYQDLERRVAERTSELEQANVALEQRAAELQIINSVQRGLASELDLQSIYRLIGERLREVFNVETVLIAFHDEEADRVVIPYYNDRGNVITTQIRPYGQGKLFESIVESGRPALFNTRDAVSAAQTTDVASPGSEADLNNSLLAVPIFREGKVVGITSVQSYQENAFDENDVALLQALTNSMSVSLENARLLDETSRLLEESQQRATELGIINNVGQALVKKMEFDAILELVGERLRDIFNADTTYIMLYEPEGQIVNPAYYVDRGQRIKLPSQKITQSLNKVIVESREPLLTGTMEESQELGALLIPSDGEKDLNQSFLGVPFFSGDQVAGVISVQSYEKYMYDESDVRLLVTLASSMSVALENARLFEETTHLLDETRQRNAELAVINSIQEGLGSKLDIQAIFELVGDKIREIFDAQVVAISTFDPETGTETWPYIIERGERLEVEPGPTYGFSGHMVETLEPLMINENMDERLEEFGAVIMAGEAAKSYLGVPLVVRGQPKGVINLQNIDHEHAFSDTDLRLLTTIAASTSVALENAQLFEETNRLLEESQQRAAELSLINNIGAALSKKLDFDAILELIGERLREIFQADTIYIMPYDAKQEVASLTYYVDQGERIEFPTNSTPQGLAKLIVDTKEPLLLGTNEEATKLGSPRVLPADGVDRNESFLGVPYFSGEDVAGVVSVQRYQQHAFDESDLRLLSTIASSMSVALENAQLFEETHNLLDDARQRNTELAAINTVSQALVAEAEIDNLIELIGEQVRSAFQADIAYVALLDSRANMIRFPYLHGEELEPIPYGEGLTSQILQSGEPLLINQDMDGAIAEMQTERIGIAAASYLGVPITVGQLAIGVISVQSTREEGRFGEADVRLLSTIAANAGAAIRNAQLLAETKRRASEMAALNEIGREASASLDLPVVLDSITRRARSMLSAESSAVILLDEDGSTLRPIAAAGDMAEEVMNFTWNLGEGIIGDTVLHGRAERISDTASDPRAIHIEGTSQEAPNEKLMVAPLFAREKVIGAMAVWRGAATEVFDDDDLSFLTGLSQQAGASIHNARLFEEIQRQKQYMEAVVQNSPVAIVTVDRDFHVVSWNPAAEKLFGYTEEEAIGRDAHELHSKDEEVLAEAHGFSEQIASGERVQAITRRTRKDGSFVDVELMGVPVVVGGEQVGNIIIYHDLSELKRAEAALLEQKEYLQAVVSNSPVAIVTADQSGRIVSWNPAAETLFGYEAEEAIGQEIDALIASADREMQAEAAEFTDQAQHGRLHVQTKRARKDGTLVDVELLGVPVTVDGAQAGIIAIYHDITELKRAMHEAEAANEAKSAFLATMSHEIRTPMNAVIGMSGLLLDTDLDEEQQEFAEIIRNSSDALLTIINDILDFSKIEAGKMELEDQPFNIRECVEGTLDLVASRAYEKGLDLAYYIEEGAPAWLVGDVTRFRQILLNLLTNAVKFTDAGEVMVTVGADDEESRKHNGRPLESGEHFLHVVVRDTGIGIPPDRMDRLFQSFSQLDASTARKYGGTGLGLAISKRLAEMMGGAMWAESELGVGTRFHFTIRGLEAEGSSQETTLDTPDSTLQGRRVLIVDDNDTNRRILSLHVKSWGMLPRDTHSPMMALEWVQEGEPFDVAILDMHMPEYDGLSLARGIRKTEAGKQLPLILFTSLGRREIETEDIEFESYLTKPIKPSQLLDALTVVFAGRPSRIQQPRADHFKPDPELGNRHPLRILLAEDNAVNQKLALRLLDQMGYRADVAGNGQEVLDSLARQEYDVVLMDVQMPEMDGLEASRRINQRWDQDERPRIIAMTANAMQGDRERCLAAGMDDYVSKPVRVHELMDALERSPINRHGER